MIEFNQLIKKLQYENSPCFLDEKQMRGGYRYAHIFRQAIECYNLKGSYCLQDPSQPASLIPLVYVCEAKNDEEASDLHRKIWNQNIVPFLLIKSPRYIRLYKGFSYNNEKHAENIFGEIEDLGRLFELGIDAESIDQGKVWDKWGPQLDLSQRVDGRLLKSLKEVENVLEKQNLETSTIHALIGKYVYLRYLRDRDILSDAKLKKWNIDPNRLFTRNATKRSFTEVNKQLDKWLNGAVFPISSDIHNNIEPEHLKKVAGTFFGDDPDTSQGSLFSLYDFSAIPTETLSTIYEQFLHATEKGKKSAAYYTPIPLVHFTVGELEKRKPLEEGMKILDPACGSGAFLVHCFRLLIEKRRLAGKKLNPSDLRKILVDQIFGIEREHDACHVTALGLFLTLLDNVTPSDLERYPTFELPNLFEKNIIESDFFDTAYNEKNFSDDASFDWIIGNPPWKQAQKEDKEKNEKNDQKALDWMKQAERKSSHVATNNELAEAFAWKAADLAADGTDTSDNGIVGFVFPTMSLTKHDKSFRERFFRENTVFSVINFSNLRKFLFESGNAPASVLTFQKGTPDSDDRIQTYAPFMIDLKYSRTAKKKTTWALTVNSSDIQELRVSEVIDGSNIHWKIAMWGTPFDLRLLQKAQRRYTTFKEFCGENDLLAAQATKFCIKSEIQDATSGEVDHKQYEYHEELIGSTKLENKALKGCGHIFQFPEESLSKKFTKEDVYLRLLSGKKGLEVLFPPHVILDPSFRFAIYSNEILGLPPRPIAIAGKKKNSTLLKAIALYLNSNFTKYHQFHTASEWGIRAARATKESLDQLPIPDALSDSKTVKEWATLYDGIASATKKERDKKLLPLLNKKVNAALGLQKMEQILVDDLVTHKLRLLDGKAPKDLSGPPDESCVDEYLNTMRDQLDDFLGNPYYHAIIAYRDSSSKETPILLQIQLFECSEPIPTEIREIPQRQTASLTRFHRNLKEQHCTWLYFQRSLLYYDLPSDDTFLLKPAEKIQWIRSKGISDAMDIIALGLEMEARNDQ